MMRCLLQDLGTHMLAVQRYEDIPVEKFRVFVSGSLTLGNTNPAARSSAIPAVM